MNTKVNIVRDVPIGDHENNDYNHDVIQIEGIKVGMPKVGNHGMNNHD